MNQILHCIFVASCNTWKTMSGRIKITFKQHNVNANKNRKSYLINICQLPFKVLYILYIFILICLINNLTTDFKFCWDGFCPSFLFYKLLGFIIIKLARQEALFLQQVSISIQMYLSRWYKDILHEIHSFMFLMKELIMGRRITYQIIIIKTIIDFCQPQFAW